MPNALLVFANPNGEVLATGGRMSRFAKSHFVHVRELAREAERELRDQRANPKLEVKSCL